MKKFKMLIIAVISISAYAEQDINTWVYKNPVTKSVYGHIRIKEKRCRDLQNLKKKVFFSKVKDVCC